jgi:hypothetical protein
MTAVTELVVIVFNLVQLLSRRDPACRVRTRPSRTQILLENAKGWIQLHGRELEAWALVVLGMLFTIRGLAEVF